MRVERVLRIPGVAAVLSKGIRCSRYRTIEKMLKAARSLKLAQELSDHELSDGPIYLLHYRDYTIIVTPSDVHVIAAEEQLDEEEARKIVEELAELMEK